MTSSFFVAFDKIYKKEKKHSESEHDKQSLAIGIKDRQFFLFSSYLMTICNIIQLLNDINITIKSCKSYQLTTILFCMWLTKMIGARCK